MRVIAALLLGCSLLLSCEADGLIWMPPIDRADALFRFVSKGLAGFIDSHGNIVIRPKLEVSSNWSQAFYDGMLMMGASNGPFLDTRGRKVLDNGFHRIWDFSEGLAVAMEKSGSQWGYIDHSGHFVIPPQFPSYPRGLVHGFSDGLAAVEVDGKLGYIDHTGRFAIEPQFVAGKPFENGIARVVVQGPCEYLDSANYGPCSLWTPSYVPRTGPNAAAAKRTRERCKWRFIDKTGKPLFATEFEAAMDFREGLAAVKIGGRWGFIDRQGKLAIPPAFTRVHPFSDGLALVDQANRHGFIDKTGAMRIPLRDPNAEPFSDGRAVIRQPDGAYVYIGTDGKQAFPGRFQLASRFFRGLAHVQLEGTESNRYDNGKFAYIDKRGRRIFTYSW